MISQISDHVTVERLVDRHTLFGGDGERPACHYQSVTTLRDLLERWVGRSRSQTPKYLETTLADIKREALEKRYDMAHDKAKFEWQMHRLDGRIERRTQRAERRSPGKFFIEPVSEETALVRQVTGRSRSRRDGAAAALHGRNLSSDAALTLVWQLRHRWPAYRETARVALWESTITDEAAVLVLAGQLEHPKPELREVARQVLRDTKISTDAGVMEYLEAARRRGLGS
jgi:hypothetical protein